jgi:hypothetical protein
LISRLAGDSYPFVAAIGPDWFHPNISHNMSWRLLSKSPFELFVATTIATTYIAALRQTADTSG